ncbi:asporin [Silurus meridionalis]|uniref:asporin n=1 Tax=Silurus meridionalis TaxID=175797 RepID=UPI001EEA6D00
MRLVLLLTLLYLCHGKPYKPINIMELMKIHDIMQQDSDGSDADDDNGDDDDDDDNNIEYNFISDCPFGCQCSRRVVQCSDLGLMSVPRDIPADTIMLDLQNNDITEIKEDDFKKLSNLYALFLVNNQISKIHPKAFQNMGKLRLLYLSYNHLTQIPENMPKNILELRIHDNKISRIRKEAFKGMQSLHVLEMSANPIANSGIELGAFDDMATLYLRIAEARLTAIPKELPSSLSELHLDYNKIAKVEVEDFMRYKHLLRLGLGFNQIKFVENGSLAYISKVREIHLDNNKLKNIPPGLNTLKYLQVVYLHANSITSVGVNDFCPTRSKAKKALYSGISLFANPVKYWQIQPATFRCTSGQRSLQLGNFRRK